MLICQLFTAFVSHACVAFSFCCISSPLWSSSSGQLTYGGYSESIVVAEHFVLRIPKNLDMAATAPLLCAGITTYAPIKRCVNTRDPLPSSLSICFPSPPHPVHSYFISLSTIRLPSTHPSTRVSTHSCLSHSVRGFSACSIRAQRVLSALFAPLALLTCVRFLSLAPPANLFSIISRYCNLCSVLFLLCVMCASVFRAGGSRRARCWVLCCVLFCVFRFCFALFYDVCDSRGSRRAMCCLCMASLPKFCVFLFCVSDILSLSGGSNSAMRWECCAILHVFRSCLLFFCVLGGSIKTKCLLGALCCVLFYVLRLLRFFSQVAQGGRNAGNVVMCVVRYSVICVFLCFALFLCPRWLKEGETLGVVGLGGLGHMAVKWGVAMGHKVIGQSDTHAHLLTRLRTRLRTGSF